MPWEEHCAAETGPGFSKRRDCVVSWKVSVQLFPKPEGDTPNIRAFSYLSDTVVIELELELSFDLPTVQVIADDTSDNVLLSRDFDQIRSPIIGPYCQPTP